MLMRAKDIISSLCDVDYTTQERVSRIMCENENDPLQSFLDMLSILMNFDLYDSEFSDYKRMEKAVIQNASNISGLLRSNVWVEIQHYLDFIASVMRQTHPGGLPRENFLEDNYQEKYYDLALEVLRSIKRGQFNPTGGLIQSVLSGDPFEEKYVFSSVTPYNVGYLKQICELFSGGPWVIPEDIVNEMNG